jgi:hypothetical protein
MTTIDIPATTRDYVRMAQYARARLIVAAADRRSVEYGELSPFAHLRWFSTRVLGVVFAECSDRGEPDLTALLVQRGEEPEDCEEAERVWDFWSGIRPRTTATATVSASG